MTQPTVLTSLSDDGRTAYVQVTPYSSTPQRALDRLRSEFPQLDEGSLCYLDAQWYQQAEPEPVAGGQAGEPGAIKLHRWRVIA